MVSDLAVRRAVRFGEFRVRMHKRTSSLPLQSGVISLRILETDSSTSAPSKVVRCFLDCFFTEMPHAAEVTSQRLLVAFA